MSRSYRKNVFATFHGNNSMKAWKTQENRRLRRCAKLKINNCLDWDNLIVPILNDFDTLWGSPDDGRKKPLDVPHLNECEVYHHERIHQSSFWSKYAEIGFDGVHYRDCRCYDSKKGWYWDVKRK